MFQTYLLSNCSKQRRCILIHAHWAADAPSQRLMLVLWGCSCSSATRHIDHESSLSYRGVRTNNDSLDLFRCCGITVFYRISSWVTMIIRNETIVLYKEKRLRKTYHLCCTSSMVPCFSVTGMINDSVFRPSYRITVMVVSGGVWHTVAGVKQRCAGAQLPSTTLSTANNNGMRYTLTRRYEGVRWDSVHNYSENNIACESPQCYSRAIICRADSMSTEYRIYMMYSSSISS